MFTGNPSSTWQAISYGFDLLKKGLVWQIGNGSNVRISRDRWLPDRDLISQKGRCRLRWVSELLDHNGDWRVDLLNQYYFLAPDVGEITKDQNFQSTKGGFSGLVTGKEWIFTVCSAYRLAFDEIHAPNLSSSSRSPNRDGWRAIWSCQAPPNVRVFTWRADINSLPTWQNKKARSLELTDYCPVCGTAPETCFHSLCVSGRMQNGCGRP